MNPELVHPRGNITAVLPLLDPAQQRRYQDALERRARCHLPQRFDTRVGSDEARTYYEEPVTTSAETTDVWHYREVGFFVAGRQRPPLMTDPTTSPQAQLTDLDYEEHVLEQPPAERVTAPVETAEDLYATGEGDLLWIDGIEYAVVKRNFGVFHSPLSIVGEDGTQGRLIGGTINQQSSIAGVAWIRALPGEDNELTPQTSDLLARFDHVYRLEEDRLDCLHAWTPDSDQRVCPACEERSGEPIRIEQQAGKAVELRQCTNTDCQHIYRYVRPFPEPDTATLLISTGSVGSPALGSGYTTSEIVDEYELSGVFRCTEQDDFKFPVETNRGRDDGYYTASEVAAFCNPKLDHDDPDDRFGTVTVDTNDRTGRTVIRWRDEPGSRAKMTVEFQELLGGTISPTPNYDRALDWYLNRDAFTAIVDHTGSTCSDTYPDPPSQQSAPNDYTTT